MHGALVRGPVRDFNVIVDRATRSASLTVREISARETIAVAPGDTCILHLISGDLENAAAGDTIVADAQLVIEPRAATCVVEVRISPR